MSAQRDPELDGLGDEQGWDLEVRELAQFMRSTPHAYTHVEPSPQFRQSLRRRLMREAYELAARPPLPWYRRILAPQPMAMAGAAVGAVLIVTVAFLYSLGPRQIDHVNVAVVSPQENAQLQPAVTPIELQFSTPMKTDSVQLLIEPTTDVTRQWDTQHKVLTITPVNGLSANTRYTVTVTSAVTAQSQPVAKIKPVVFSTLPTPAPTPSTGPHPSPPASPILNPRDLAPIGSGSRVRWSIDGSSLYVIGPAGQLEQIALSGGAPQPQKLADAVTLFAVAPDGSGVAWLSGGQLTWKSTVLNNVQPIALGFRSGLVLLADGDGVLTAEQRRVASFKETATAADFTAGGDRVAYLGTSGLHLVDLTSGRDTTVGPAIGLGAWGPDSHHYAYVTSGGVSVADAYDGSTASAVTLAGVTGLSWSRGQQLLMSATNGLFMADYAGAGPATARPLSSPTDPAFSMPDWAPNGSGQFSFHRGADVWVAKVQNAVAGTPTPVSPGPNQDDLVAGFMNARKNGQAEQAGSFLDQAGTNAFSQLKLVYTDPALARYYVLLSQPGRVVVRLVLVHGLVQTAVDETLTIQIDANNHPLIHSAVETPRQSFGSGPEVVSTTVTSNQVQITFDSDLDPNSAVQQGAVAIKGVPTQSRYDVSSKTVTLTVPGGLTPGASYDLLIAPSLQDLNHRSAVAYDLPFTGPSN